MYLTHIFGAEIGFIEKKDLSIKWKIWIPVFASKFAVIYLTQIFGAEIGFIDKKDLSINPLTVFVGFFRQFHDILHIFKMAHFVALPVRFEQNRYARSIHD